MANPGLFEQTMKHSNALMAAVIALSMSPFAFASDTPPAGSTPLSSILNANASADSTIVSAEFDDGLWELEVCATNACEKVYVDPKTGKETRRRAIRNQSRPAAGSVSIAQIAAQEEKGGNGTITEIEFDDGRWEVTLDRNGEDSKIWFDARTGGLGAIRLDDTPTK